MSARKAVTELIIGGPPRVDLLPPEVRERERGRAAAGGAVFAIVIAAGVVAAGYAVGTVINITAQTHLDSVSNRTQQLLSEQQQYAEVQQIEGHLGLAEAAQRTGAASMAKWGWIVTQISAVLPGTVQGFNGEVATPLEGYPQSTLPLQSARLGSLQVVVRTGTLPEVSAWIDALEKLDFVVDAVPGTFSVLEDGTYVSDVRVTFNEEAIENPFAIEDDEESDETEGDADEEEAGS